MKQVNIHEAKTHLSSLIEGAVNGEPFIIAKSGKPQVIVYSYQSLQIKQKRTGFMPDINIPSDFDNLETDKITAMLHGDK